ncbi:MAG TPA: hypothetical protein VNU97_01975 [Rhizomicrobium sp.]|jgi:hypothetical protein|nr:hypothetical protein [Rhizomicrobium sp.]
MDDRELIHYLAGQVNTLTTFAAATIKAFPSPHALRAAFQDSEQKALAAAEIREVPETYVRGLQDTAKSLLSLLEATAP